MRFKVKSSPTVRSNKPVMTDESNLPNIWMIFLLAPILTHLGKNFNNALFLFVETTKGKFDLLFDEEGQLL